MKVCSQEVFGPLIGVQGYTDVGDALALANDSRYGLQAAIFTNDLRTALRAAHELDFGGVTVNEMPTFRTDQMPYGGREGQRQHPRGSALRGPGDDRGAAGRHPDVTGRRGPRREDPTVYGPGHGSTRRQGRADHRRGFGHRPGDGPALRRRGRAHLRGRLRRRARPRRRRRASAAIYVHADAGDAERGRRRVRRVRARAGRGRHRLPERGHRDRRVRHDRAHRRRVPAHHARERRRRRVGHPGRDPGDAASGWGCDRRHELARRADPVRDGPGLRPHQARRRRASSAASRRRCGRSASPPTR